MQSLVLYIGQVTVDIYAAAEWFIQTIASQIGNREIATVIVFIVLLLLVIANGGGKTIFKGFIEVILCALTPKLFIPALLLIVYSILIFSLASHSDIERISGYVPDAMKSVSHLTVCRDDDAAVVGFVGVEGTMVEMLFVNPAFRGRGVGTRLLDHAVARHGATLVDVNEQNEQAVGFYRHYGFEVIGRSETDGMGEPFPLLHMRLSA